MANYESAFFIVPSRIINLPDLTLSYLKIYETIFQFWNHGKVCYLSNDAIMERTGVKSISTVMDAFAFFEKHGEMRRLRKGTKRYLMQPLPTIEGEDDFDEAVDNREKSSSDDDQTIALPIDNYRWNDSVGIAPAIHNINNLNNKNLNKSFCEKAKKEDNQKMHSFAYSMNQNANEKKNIAEHEKLKRSTMPPELKEIIKGLKCLN